MKKLGQGFYFKVLRNPWDHTVDLNEVFWRVLKVRSAHVGKMFEAGEYKRDSLGLAFMDPIAPISLPSKEAVLAIATIGPEGAKYLVNAIAKAVQHRDSGLTAGYGAYIDLTRTRDGDFCYGFSTMVDGTIVGASGQSEIQDAMEAGHAGVSFNYFVRQARAEWREAHPDNSWFCNKDRPEAYYTAIAERLSDK